MPHHAADAMVAASSIVMALQTIVSHNVNPLHTGIISVGAFIAGDAPNVIPGVAELHLTVRTFRPDVRDLLEERITEFAQTQAAVFGTTADVNYIPRYQRRVGLQRQRVVDRGELLGEVGAGVVAQG